MRKSAANPRDVMTTLPSAERDWRSTPQILEEEAESELAGREDTTRSPRVWSTSILELAGYSLRFPLVIKVEDFGDEVIAALPEVEAFGSASTEADAINELKVALRDLHDELEAAPEAELGPLPAGWRRALRAAIVSSL